MRLIWEIMRDAWLLDFMIFHSSAGSYHLYVGHGLVVKYFRDQNIDGEIGIALNLMGRLPLADREEDLKASRRADGYLNRWFAEPIALERILRT